MIRLLLLTTIATLAGSMSMQAQEEQEKWSVTSPNGKVKLSVRLADLAGTADYPKGKCLYYRVEQGAEGKRAVMMNDSPLGLKLQNGDFLNGLVFDSAQPPRQIDESYEMPHGKRLKCHNRAQHQTLVFHNTAGKSIEIDLRAYDDGAAFRYRLPGNDPAMQTFESESTGFALPQGTKLCMAESDDAGPYTPAYEMYYATDIAIGTPAKPKVGWAFPALFQTPEGRWGLMTESNVGENFCVSRLSNDAPGGVYRVWLPHPNEGNRQGAAQPSASLPWEMPWRVIIVGESLGDIVESTLVTDVADPSRIQDPSWIRPGRVAWSWWSDNASPRDGGKLCKSVDLAAEMGWEYILVDANWDLMDNGNIHDVLRYAKKKGVGVLLWYNSGGPHNLVTEKPRDTLTYEKVRQFEMELLKKGDVKGIKVDFFMSDKQNVIQIYHGIMRDAAAAKILVDFHGCTIPHGWERTWPNLMTMEAVRGAECYIFDKNFPERAAKQSTILPFTRNAIGPMDYTPVAFSDNVFPHLTTYAHELAQAVLFESGLLHLADKPEAYLNLPKEPKEFLKQVPVVWDDTRYVAGTPGDFVILARRHGDTWYLAGVNGKTEAREEKVKPGDWLKRGRYQLTLIADGADAKSFASETRAFESGGEFTVKMLPYGGFTATLSAVK